MNRARRPWWLAAALVAMVIALWWQARINTPASASASAPAPAPAQTDAGAGAIGMRTPVSDPGSPAPAPAPEPAPAPALTLVGTTVGGAGSFATVRRTAGAQPLLLRVGDRIDGLVVTAVEPDRIVLAGAAEPPIVIEVERTAAAPLPPPVRARAAGATAAAQQQPAFAEGEAPWDAGADFRH